MSHRLALTTAGFFAPIAGDTITAGIGDPFGLAFDASGTIWVANGFGTVTAYAPGTNSPIAADTITPPAAAAPLRVAFTP